MKHAEHPNGQMPDGSVMRTAIAERDPRGAGERHGWLIDYNCLHQDLYGDIHFPLQAIVLLDRPMLDFEGGELLLVEQPPRKQSRARVIPLVQGAIAVIPVKERLVESARGVSRIQVRHGVSEVQRGLRPTLGVIFHDAV
jgi:hypothetical protein